MNLLPSGKVLVAGGEDAASTVLATTTIYDPATNRLRPKDQLARIAAKLPTGPVVTYCNTGHWAATDWFVLHELLGYNRVRNYDGSWTEYGSLIGVPIEKPAPVTAG